MPAESVNSCVTGAMLFTNRCWSSVFGETSCAAMAIQYSFYIVEQQPATLFYLLWALQIAVPGRFEAISSGGPSQREGAATKKAFGTFLSKHPFAIIRFQNLQVSAYLGWVPWARPDLLRTSRFLRHMADWVASNQKRNAGT